MPNAVRTVVHLMRHGEVFNPDKILYGRLPGYHLSERGHEMAQMVADHLAGRDITVVTASPLQRAQETAAPIGEVLGREVGTDERLIEAGNHFEGLQFGHGKGSLWNPKHWPYLVNPLRPSWGEPYTQIAERMLAVVADTERAARGHEAVLVSHQLPVWTTRCRLEGRRLWHDPRDRECNLASLTSLYYRDGALEDVVYSEPAASLLEGAQPGAGA